MATLLHLIHPQPFTSPDQQHRRQELPQDRYWICSLPHNTRKHFLILTAVWMFYAVYVLLAADTVNKKKKNVRSRTQNGFIALLYIHICNVMYVCMVTSTRWSPNIRQWIHKDSDAQNRQSKITCHNDSWTCGTTWTTKSTVVSAGTIHFDTKFRILSKHFSHNKHQAFNTVYRLVPSLSWALKLQVLLDYCPAFNN
jgi:hypothetical protein